MNLDISGINGTVEEWISMSGFELDESNTSKRQSIRPQGSHTDFSHTETVLPPASWNMLRISL